MDVLLNFAPCSPVCLLRLRGLTAPPFHLHHFLPYLIFYYRISVVFFRVQHGPFPRALINCRSYLAAPNIIKYSTFICFSVLFRRLYWLAVPFRTYTSTKIVFIRMCACCLSVYVCCCLLLSSPESTKLVRVCRNHGCTLCDWKLGTVSPLRQFIEICELVRSLCLFNIALFVYISEYWIQ